MMQTTVRFFHLVARLHIRRLVRRRRCVERADHRRSNLMQVAFHSRLFFFDHRRFRFRCRRFRGRCLNGSSCRSRFDRCRSGRRRRRDRRLCGRSRRNGNSSRSFFHMYFCFALFVYEFVNRGLVDQADQFTDFLNFSSISHLSPSIVQPVPFWRCLNVSITIIHTTVGQTKDFSAKKEAALKSSAFIQPAETQPSRIQHRVFLFHHMNDFIRRSS